ncbi:MAG TPA: RIO1 family regulatory kinase/ATPase [Methanothrix sp.]|nr:RIO1 family regulatory kinase/ATPase [Methanothrix sp.]HPJ84356.1 RIO1 family regulatory kinase/ATPase [Methanothrix sp.]
MENLAETFLKLDRKEIILLKTIERGMRHCEWVPTEELMARSRLSPKGVSSGLSKLVEKKLVFRTKEPYDGYAIGFAAYDLVALSDLVDRDVVVSLGDLLGVGKESVVYEALGRISSAPAAETGAERKAEEATEATGGLPLAVKFHRQGETSFKHVRRVREHLRDLPRCAWIHAARLGAAKEFKTLKRLYPEVSVPRPVALSHHAVVMEHSGGTELYKLDLENPAECLDIILEEVAAAWGKGIVHADLSAYNVLAGVKGEIVIIDWPQAVSRTHPQAQELLERDTKNVVSHFQRKYRLDFEAEDALAFVLGEEKEGENVGAKKDDRWRMKGERERDPS